MPKGTRMHRILGMKETSVHFWDVGAGILRGDVTRKVKHGDMEYSVGKGDYKRFAVNPQLESTLGFTQTFNTFLKFNGLKPEHYKVMPIFGGVQLGESHPSSDGIHRKLYDRYIDDENMRRVRIQEYFPSKPSLPELKEFLKSRAEKK